MKIFETKRTILRETIESDGEFILDLLNQPSFIKYIGDRNVRTVEAAREYIESRFTANYKRFGFGLWTVELKAEFDDLAHTRFSVSAIENPKSKIQHRQIGICGFVKRDTLPDADIGFALLPQFERKGYAFESADAVMRYGREVLKLPRVLAITTIDNLSSGKLLEKIGLKFDRMISPPDGIEELKLFSTEIAQK